MSITSFIKKVCVQTAVYWGNPVEDGYGVKTYDAPREIKCRWTEKNRIIYNTLGNEEVSKADVLVVEDLDIDGYIYLGFLMDLEDPNNNYAVSSNPMTISGAHKIIAIDREPLYRSATEFVKTLYLGFKNV